MNPIYKDPVVLTHMVVIFLMLVTIVFQCLKEMPLFDNTVSKCIIACSVAGLSLIGMDHTIIEWIVVPYAFFGKFVLVGLVLLLGLACIGIGRRTFRMIEEE